MEAYPSPNTAEYQLRPSFSFQVWCIHMVQKWHGKNQAYRNMKALCSAVEDFFYCFMEQKNEQKNTKNIAAWRCRTTKESDLSILYVPDFCCHHCHFVLLLQDSIWASGDKYCLLTVFAVDCLKRRVEGDYADTGVLFNFQ